MITGRHPYLLKLTLAVAFTLIITFCNKADCLAQEISIDIETPGTRFMIGEHVPLKVIVIADKSVTVNWPEFNDTLPQKMVVLRNDSIEASTTNDGFIVYTKQLIITAYDSGTYRVSPIVVQYFNPGSSFVKEGSTPQLLLTFDLEDVQDDDLIKDIKPPFGYPLTFKEVLPWLLLFVAIVAMGYFLYRYFRMLRKKGKERVPEDTASSFIRSTPWDLALALLKEIKIPENEKDIMPYYERVSIIVRSYLKEGHAINAPELTTNEVVYLVSEISVFSEAAKSNLLRLLSLADLVKFAKYHPNNADHHNIKEDAITFVSDTMPTIVEQEDNKHNNNDPDQSKEDVR